MEQEESNDPGTPKKEAASPSLLDDYETLYYNKAYRELFGTTQGYYGQIYSQEKIRQLWHLNWNQAKCLTHKVLGPLYSCFHESEYCVHLFPMPEAWVLCMDLFGGVEGFLERKEESKQLERRAKLVEQKLENDRRNKNQENIAIKALRNVTYTEALLEEIVKTVSKQNQECRLLTLLEAKRLRKERHQRE